MMIANRLLRPLLPVLTLLFLAMLPATAALYAQDSQAPADVATTESPEAASTENPTGFFTEVLDVRVINVEVFVSDRSGTPVAGLGPEDFELRVDGAPIEISNFYAEAGGRVRPIVGAVERPADPSFRTVEEVAAETPRRSHVVVLLDHTRLSSNNRKRTLRSLREAVSSLGKEDLVSVIGIEGSLIFYSDFLFDRQAIDRILEDATHKAVQSNIHETERRLIFGELTRGQSGGILAREFTSAESGPILTRIQAYAAQEYQRGVRSLQQIEHVVSTLAGVPGRKMLLYVAEGIPTRPGEGLYVEWRNRFGAGSPNAEVGVRRIDFSTDYVRSVGRFDLNANMLNLARATNRAGVTLYSIDAEGNHGGIIRSALTEQ
ncbi:MAG: VWA domain-containing protein, partial [Acidobacteriota bacterium]|nr:VWA domain-containing protein [Acidobacteriota bacterium]